MITAASSPYPSSARRLHLFHFSDSPLRIKQTFQHLLPIFWKTAAVAQTQAGQKNISEHVCCVLWLRVGLPFFFFPEWSIMLELMQQLGWYLHNNLPAAASSSLTCTQTSTAWLWFYCLHIKLLFWDGNLAQSLLICLAFSVPIGDSSPWQTNKPLLGVWAKLLKENSARWGRREHFKAKPFPRNKCTLKPWEVCTGKLPLETPMDSVSLCCCSALGCHVISTTLACITLTLAVSGCHLYLKRFSGMRSSWLVWRGEIQSCLQRCFAQ